MKGNNDEIRIAFMGDINPGGVLTFSGGISNRVKDCLRSFDLRVATLESSLGEGILFDEKKIADPKKAYIIFSPDSSVSLINQIQIDAVSLANNHVTDCGLDGLYHTMDVLNNANVRCFGAGHNRNEAGNACIFEIKGKKVCLLGYCTPWKFLHFPTDNEGGTNMIDAEKIINDVKYYKSLCDYVFVMPHWGKEKTIWPKKSEILLAKKIIKAGATGVIGSHTHTVQPMIISGNGVMAMSLGNFIFPDRYINYPKVTCYPSEEERNKKDVPITDGFPLVHSLTYKRIPAHLRRGVICEVILKNKKVSIKRHYTYMDEDNNVCIRDCTMAQKLKLFIIGIWIRFC